MENESQDDSQINDALRPAQMELQAVDSIRVDVSRRLAGVRIQPTVPPSLLAAMGMILVGAVGVWIGRHEAKQKISAEPTKLVADSEPGIVLDLGNVQLTEQLSAFVDDRAVVVIWTCKGTSQVPDITLSDRHYKEIPLTRTTTRDGQTLRCALFVPQAGTRPGLTPPEIAAPLPGNQVIRFSALPTLITQHDLSGAIRAAARSANAESQGDELAAAVEREMR